ncbi:hypothetical protein D9619_002808 [Psilocybe cf. subviscida]|uniref:F5/8 type C domain-containing protein n=1 Tax=Psilocybe cf. subviscida TaxID=2480587 RepID=A0A8H5ETN0_9AGAR|nr:hypothetical protein D9619_002808 [Psilocybe cf. subviscida]
MADGELVSLIDAETSIKASSTLEKATGKKNIIDGSPETCWTSQQGLPQFIQLGFSGRVIPKRLVITFQGGFVGRTCALYTLKDEGTKDWQKFAVIYPEDVNRAQLFDLVPTAPEILEGGVKALKLVFEESTDFFGRITIYELKLDGVFILTQP